MSRNRQGRYPFVEQQNANPVGAYPGYDRRDTVAQTLALNELYELIRLYYSFFQRVVR